MSVWRPGVVMTTPEIEELEDVWAGGLAGHKEDVVVIRARVDAAAVIMRGTLQEAELVVNTSDVDGSTIEILSG